MILNKMAIKQGTSVLVFLFIVCMTGIYSWFALPREAAPEVVVPIVSVLTTYQGVAPEDIESLITIPIERKLTGLSGLKEITSNSVEGASSIVIEFDTRTDIETALQKVRDKVDQAKMDLPREADDSNISEINLSEIPVMYLSLTGDIGVAALDALAKDMEDDIESIKGVLNVDIIGGVEREIQIEVDPDRVAQYGVSLADLVTLTQMENVNTPGGTMDLGEAKFLVRVPGEFKTPDELTGLVVKRGSSGVVYLRDIATIRDGFKEITTASRVNGRQAITLSVAKRAGENIIRITDDVKAYMENLKDRLPPGVTVETTMDMSEEIRDMVADLENGMISGLILVLCCIVFSMGFVNALFIALAIPISMFITFTILYMTGVTLNMIVLFSLILVLGNLVDVSIVVVENTYRHMQMGRGRREAAYLGASEVAWPIIGSTMTTVAGFFPMLFWPGVMGDFMGYLPMTASIALLASLFVGMVVNPAINSKFMPKPRKIYVDELKAHRGPILRAYARFLSTILRWRMVTIFFSFAVLVVIIAIFMQNAKVEFMPDTEPRHAYIDLDAPEGTNLQTSDQIVREMEQRLAPVQDKTKYLIANVGSRGVQAFNMEGGGGTTTHLNRIALNFPKLAQCKELPSRVVERARELAGKIAGVKLHFKKEENGPPTGPPVNIELSGDDFETLADLSKQIQNIIKDVPGLVDLRDDYERGKPEVRVNVDRQQAWMNALSTQFVGMTVKAAINGSKAGDYREGDEQYDVTVRFPKSFREDIRNIESMNLINIAGTPIPFSAVAKLEQGAGLGTIKRIDRKRTVTVMAEVQGRYGTEVLADCQQLLTRFKVPAGYNISYTGESEDQQESADFLGKAFLVAILLITLVMVVEFNSLIQPLIIMTTVILSLAGVFLALIIFDMPFGIIMTGIAVISLAGVVVNNGIVLVDFINQCIARGMDCQTAIVEAATTRFRPVMLTAVTTVIGLVPMAVGISYDFRNLEWVVGGESSQWWAPMSIAVIVGLLFATFLTLVVVPILYSVVEGIRAFFGYSIEANMNRNSETKEADL